MLACVYATTTAGESAGLLAQTFFDIAELWSAGLLTDESAVWVDATAPAPALWALARGRSQYLYIHRATEPGYVRLTAGRARVARTFDDTANGRAVVDLAAKQLPVPNARVTLAVIHRMPGRGVAVIDDSRRVTLDNGSYQKGSFTVVDVPAYTAPSPPAEPADFERTHAAFNGVVLMTERLSRDDAELVRNHLDAFQFDIPAKDLIAVNQYRAAVDAYGAQFASAIVERLQNRPIT